MNKKKNRGFSLVELIVVVAIMAVLVGVLAPSLLRYVEKTRLQKDNSAISEVAEAAKIACADETISKAVAGETGGVTITIDGSAFSTTGATANVSAVADLATELANVCGTVTLSSNTYTTATNKPTLTVTVDSSTGVVTITGANIINTVGGSAQSPTY